MPRAGPSHTLVADTADAYQRITPSSETTITNATATPCSSPSDRCDQYVLSDGRTSVRPKLPSKELRLRSTRFVRRWT